MVYGGQSDWLGVRDDFRNWLVRHAPEGVNAEIHRCPDLAVPVRCWNFCHSDTKYSKGRCR
jgi:hypothetical protein